MYRSLFYIFIVAALLVVLIITGGERETRTPPTLPEDSAGTQSTSRTEGSARKSSDDPLTRNATRTARVARVIDGDTIELQNGETVRYIGVDTPETVHPDKPSECFGAAASRKNRELVEGKQVRLERDVSNSDKYGRLLRYVYVGDTFVNKYLVAHGFAHAVSYPPDVKYQDVFRKAQRTARRNERGAWGACTDTAKRTSEKTEAGNKRDCRIKGNISYEDKEKIYHIPGCEYYEETVINEEKGERWFCSEEAAREAGWRKAYNCQKTRY